MSLDDVPQDAPDRIGPDYSPQRTFSEHISHIYKAFTTKYFSTQKANRRYEHG
jgi:hypothetical protein